MKPLRCALAVAIVVCSGQTVAQELEEIVVSARKVEESLQEVPVSISAFSSNDLEERGLDDVMDISQFTPGFSFEKLNRYGVQGGGSRPVIRGMSQILGEANAAVFIDGMQYTDSILSFPFDIVERVEVIKGPQAALFGRSTFAGAINLITKGGSNEFENKISTRIGDYSEYEVNALSRGPLVEDKVFYMAHVRYYEFGGFHQNSLDLQRLGSEESVNFNGSLEFRPNDAFSARFDVGLGNDEDGPPALTLQDRFSNNCFLNVGRQYYCGEVNPTPPPEQNIAFFDGALGLDKDFSRFAARLTYDAGAFKIISNTGYFQAEQDYGYDVDLTANTTTFGGTFNRIAVSDRTEISTELMIQSNTDSRLSYLAGVYYYKSRRDFREDRLAGFTVDQGEARVDNSAIFGSLAYDFTDRLTGSVELRVAKDKIGNFNPVARPTVPTLEETFNSTSPRVTLDWQANDETMVYLSYAVGNKPGFINANPNLLPQFQFAEEEESKNWEVGTKNTLNGGRMTLNLAYYNIDWDKQQLTTITTLTTGAPASAVINAGKTKVDGFEIEITNAFTDQFTAGFGYSLNDARFKENNDTEYAIFFGPPGSVKGNQTPNSSKHQMNLFGRFEFPVRGDLSGYVRGDLSYASRKYAQVFNLAHSGDQKLINLKAGIQGDKWNVGVYVDNLTDDRTPTTVIRFVDFENFLPVGTSARTSGFVRAFQYPLADKRQWGMTASYSF